MKAIVSVIGRDKVGIIAKVSSALADCGANVEDISQTVMQDYFTMIMMVEASDGTDLSQLGEKLDELGKAVGVTIRIQHTDIFNAMHKL